MFNNFRTYARNRGWLESQSSIETAVVPTEHGAMFNIKVNGTWHTAFRYTLSSDLATNKLEYVLPLDTVTWTNTPKLEFDQGDSKAVTNVHLTDGILDVSWSLSEIQVMMP